MHETASGFQTGPQIIKDLGLVEQCFNEDFFVSAPCLHKQQIQHRASVGLLGMVFRGVIRHFEYSAIARRIGARAYLNTSSYEQKQMQKSAEDQCTYCRAPLVRLPPALSENPICDTESLPPDGDLDYQQNEGKGVTVSGYCCLNGHLIGLYDGWDGGQLLNREVLPDPGAGLSIETCRVRSVLSSALAPNPANNSCDLTVKQSLDAFSAARKIKCLAESIEKGEGEVNLMDAEVDDAEVEELWPAGDVQTDSEYLIRARQSMLDCRMDWIEAHFKAKQFRMSALESAQELEVTTSGDTPFWIINETELASVKNLLDSVPESEGVFLEYLMHREHTASIPLEHIRHLELHNLRSQELEEARKKLISTALAALGVRVATRGWLRGQWPDSPSVQNFIKLGDQSVYEVVMCQKSVLQERKLAAAARRKPKLEARGKVSG
ncbi:hypothetical protein KFL_005220020 [Klebsormidium nitens]|uniref:Uncharacterized protein n=1 Tax=Klebsormidium nitens TaxID=105231 RepID=A0A1Y1IES8_KLENI|nr:hypothetical protein KFL_005220020 [Klebsormidium nitens]|eukprot:GAQ89434.1 hypothetical protein KFL_005220020 [Klebsormidium nitens]